MRFKNKLLGLGTAALIGLNSLLPVNAKADSSNLENRVSNARSSARTAEEFSEEHLFDIPNKYLNWYFADLFMVAVHEQGHYDEAYNQHLDPSIEFEYSPFFVNGGMNYEFTAKTKEDEARISIAGFKNTGLLAESLKEGILMGRVSEDEIRFKSMLALVSELNLPFYLGQHYLGMAQDGNLNDIENFTENSGISPETMLISSGAHILANAPYIYYLTKNVLGSSPKVLEPKPYFLSFRYDGDSYMLYLHLDVNKL